MTTGDGHTGGVTLTIKGGVGTIMFDRQSTRNAMAEQSWLSLRDWIVRADGDRRVGVIVLRGAGGHFGAGNDIVEFGALHGNASGARAFGWAMARAMASVERATKPVVAAIEGSCFGASVALALAADIRLASADARMAITPAKLGVVYLQSDHVRLVAAVGPGRARQLIFTAQMIAAAQALNIGLVDQVAAQVEFSDSLDALTTAILAGSAYSIQCAKRMLTAPIWEANTLETDESIEQFVAAIMNEDFGEGVAAFRARRPPRFANSFLLAD